MTAIQQIRFDYFITILTKRTRLKCLLLYTNLLTNSLTNQSLEKVVTHGLIALLCNINIKVKYFYINASVFLVYIKILEGYNSMAITLKKIHNQLKNIQQNPPTKWRAVKDEDLKWTIWMQVQKTSPFYGYPIKVKVVFPQNYPSLKPNIKLCRPQLFYHANIGSQGQICHKVIDGDEIVSIRERIQYLINLLSTPNFDSCLNSSAGKLCKQNRKQWYRKALKIFRGLQKK